jgi:hypothetical protein
VPCRERTSPDSSSGSDVEVDVDAVDEPEVDLPSPSLSSFPVLFVLRLALRAMNSDTSDANNPLDPEPARAQRRDEDADSVACIAGSPSLLSPSFPLPLFCFFLLLAERRNNPHTHCEPCVAPDVECSDSARLCPGPGPYVNLAQKPTRPPIWRAPPPCQEGVEVEHGICGHSLVFPPPSVSSCPVAASFTPSSSDWGARSSLPRFLALPPRGTASLVNKYSPQ